MGGDALIFGHSAPATDTVIRPTAFGTTLVEHLPGPAAPTEFSWEVGLAEGDKLHELPNGSVAVVRADGIELSERDVLPGAGESDPLDISDVSSQLIRAGHTSPKPTMQSKRKS